MEKKDRDMSFPHQDIKRQRITVKVSEAFDTLRIEKIEEEGEDIKEDSVKAIRWRQSRVIWSVPISLTAAWHLLKWITGGGIM